MVGPKEIGEVEKERTKHEGEAFREWGEDGFMKADEETLMGGGMALGKGESSASHRPSFYGPHRARFLLVTEHSLSLP
jgi:protein associated with RNAse G/E